MSPTLFLEAFGQISGPATIDSQEEDLHSVFRERAKLMRWAATPIDHPLLWSMEEAEITADTDSYRIGWVQVGLGVGSVEMLSTPTNPSPGWASSPTRRRSTDPVLALAPLIQCFSDALRRFGSVELSGFQVTASGLESDAQSCIGYLVSVLNWFNTGMKTKNEAIVAFDQGLLQGDRVPELVGALRHRNTAPFEFKTHADMHERHRVKVPVETPFHSAAPLSEIGVSVMLPEWTPSSAGWVLASVVDAARLIEPDVSNFAVRLTRFR